eukprot:5710_1
MKKKQRKQMINELSNKANELKKFNKSMNNILKMDGDIENEMAQTPQLSSKRNKDLLNHFQFESQHINIDYVMVETDGSMQMENIENENENEFPSTGGSIPRKSMVYTE